MKGNKCDFLVLKKLFNLLTFKEKIHVLNNFNTYNLNAHDKLELINSLPYKIRLNELEIIFKCHELYHVTKEELLDIYKKLNYKDKMHLLDVLSTYELKKELLDTLTEKEIYNFFKTPPFCSNKEIREYLANRLPEDTCIKLFNKLPQNTHTKQKISLLKNLPESFLKDYLENNKHHLVRYNNNYSEEVQEICAEIIKLCFTEEEKIACLKKNNRYGIDLNHNEKRAIIGTCSDEIKLKIIQEEDYQKYNFYPYGIQDSEILCQSLSDKTLISLINNQSFISEYFDGEVSSLISILSPTACLELLNNRHKYICLYNPKNLLELLKKLPPNVKQLFLNSNNQYHISLTNQELVELIKTFPDEEKIAIYNDNSTILSNDELDYIITSVKNTKLINYLLTEKLNIKTLNSLTRIINYLTHDLSAILLKNHNINIQNFVNRHRQTILNNLHYYDKLGIINTPDNYTFKVTDDELIAILKNLSQSSYDEIEHNILTRFKNPDYFVDYFINNMPEFKIINEKIQKQIIKYYANKKNITIDEDFIYYMLRYNTNGKILIDNYQKYQEFLRILNINIDDFIQYGINSHKINYLEAILAIINNNEIEKIHNLLNYLQINYYHTQNYSRDTVKSFLEVIYIIHIHN